MFTPEDRRAHVAGIVARSASPEPTALDRLHAVMRLNPQMPRKVAERHVMEQYPEFAGAFPDRPAE